MIDIKTVFHAQRLVGNGIERYIYDAYFYYEKKISLSQVSMIIGDLHFLGETDDELVEDYTYEVLTEKAIPLHMTEGDVDVTE